MVNYVALVLISCVTFFLKSITIGSDTAVTRFNNQVTLNNGDIVAGFAALQGGFFINDASVTATWSSLFPVSGNLNFNNGTLFLARDLTVNNIVSTIILGNVIGNNYTLDLAATATIFLVGNCTQALQSITNIGVLAFGNSCDWSYDDKFIAVVGINVANSVETYQYDGSTVSFADGASPDFFLRAVRWRPNNYYVAVGAGFSGNVNVYAVDGTTGLLTLTSASSLGSGVTYDLSWHPNGLYLAAATSVTTSEIALYPVTVNGILGAPLLLNRPQPALSCDWAATGSYLAVGFSGAAANEIEVYQLNPGPTLTLLTSASSLFDVNSLRWNRTYSNIFAVGLNNSAAGESVQIYRYTNSNNTLTKVASLSGLGVIRSVDWSPDGNCLLVAINSTAVSVNKLLLYTYNNQTNSLTFAQGINFANNSISSNAATFSHIYGYIAQTAATTTFSSNLRVSTPQAGSAVCANYTNLTLFLQNDLVFQNCCITFKGNCSILGNGNTLSLDANSMWSIADNSTLRLKNLKLTGIKDNALQMLAGSSNLILDNVTLLLDSNYTFSQGSLTINKDVVFSGAGTTLVYSSTRLCTITSKGSLFLDANLTFSYAPASNSNSLLQFIDRSSKFFLNGATLVATRTGLSLTKGTLVIDRHAYITSDARVAAEGIIMGDGISAANNLSVQLYPSAILETTKGMIVNKNI